MTLLDLLFFNDIIYNTKYLWAKFANEKEIFIMTIKPLADNVVIRATKAEETTKSGIVLTSASKEKPQIAEVVAVGPGGIVDGKEIKMTVKAGDKVIAAKYAGTEVKIDDEEYTILHLADILAVVE